MHSAPAQRLQNRIQWAGFRASNPQADARFLRELDDALPAAPAPQPGVAGAFGDGLEALSARDLKTLCNERGYKGCTCLSKAAFPVQHGSHL